MNQIQVQCKGRIVVDQGTHLGKKSEKLLGRIFLLLSPGIIGVEFADLTWAGPHEVCGSCRASKLRQSDAFAISWWGSPSRQFRLLVSKAEQVFISHGIRLDSV